VPTVDDIRAGTSRAGLFAGAVAPIAVGLLAATHLVASPPPASESIAYVLLLVCGLMLLSGVVAAMLGSLAGVLIATPIFLALHKRGLWNLPVSLIVGAGLGCAVGALRLVPPFSLLELSVVSQTLATLVGAVCGFLAYRYSLLPSRRSNKSLERTREG
jgi:hypothetical protein